MKRMTLRQMIRERRPSTHKLDEQRVAVIKARLHLGETPRQIAPDYGVNESTIRSIRNGDTWVYVQPDLAGGAA